MEHLRKGTLGYVSVMLWEAFSHAFTTDAG